MPSLESQTPDNKQHFEIITQTEGVSALDHLYTFLQNPNPSSAVTLSKQQLKEYASKGAVWLTLCPPKTAKKNKPRKTERLRRLKKTLKLGDQLDFYYNPDLLEAEPIAPSLIVDFESYSVWLKPRGMLSQGSKWADHTALYRWVEMYYKPNDQPRQSWIVHRLDRATQGLMLLAHSKTMASKLSRLFEQREIHKTYQANVWGKFPEQRQTITLAVDSKPAISHITLLKFYAEKNISRVVIEIETGRKHQIRCHLSQTGFPIVGDRLYGEEELDQVFENRPDLQLTAFKLSFICPLTQSPQNIELTEQQLDLLDY